MRSNFAPEVPTTELFIQTVIDRQSCGKHNADKGAPCGWMGPYRSICNKRARSAGFDNKISEKSLRLNRHPKKR